MADNTTLNPGVGGDVIRDLNRLSGGVRTQVMQLDVGGDSSQPESLVSLSNPMPVQAYGELIEAIEAMRMAIQALTRSVGLQTVDAAGRQRVVLDALGGSQILGTISTVTTVNTVTNQAQVGGIAMQDQIPTLLHMSADNLRRNITVS